LPFETILFGRADCSFDCASHRRLVKTYSLTRRHDIHRRRVVVTNFFRTDIVNDRLRENGIIRATKKERLAIINDRPFRSRFVKTNLFTCNASYPTYECFPFLRRYKTQLDYIILRRYDGIFRRNFAQMLRSLFNE